MKKRKLNSTNPKYYPIPETEQINVRKDLIANINMGGERNVNVYAVFEID